MPHTVDSLRGPKAGKGLRVEERLDVDLLNCITETVNVVPVQFVTERSHLH